MATQFHTKVTLAGFHWEDSSLTFNLASGIVYGDIGKAVAIDATAANRVKLAGDGDAIVGRLASVEDRTVEGIKVGAVELQFANTLPLGVGASTGLAVGDTVQGAGDGAVKKAAANDPRKNFIAEIRGTTEVVVVQV